MERTDPDPRRLGADTEDNVKRWVGLPGVFWSQSVLRPKPGARVLAENFL